MDSSHLLQEREGSNIQPFNSIEWIHIDLSTARTDALIAFNSIEWIPGGYLDVKMLRHTVLAFNSIEWIPTF